MCKYYLAQLFYIAYNYINSRRPTGLDTLPQNIQEFWVPKWNLRVKRNATLNFRYLLESNVGDAILTKAEVSVELHAAQQLRFLSFNIEFLFTVGVASHGFAYWMYIYSIDSKYSPVDNCIVDWLSRWRPISQFTEAETRFARDYTGKPYSMQRRRRDMAGYIHVARRWRAGPHCF